MDHPKTVAIMQPTFLPWAGYFGMISLADCFVFLDDVQFSKQSWQARNRVTGSNGVVSLVVPVSRDSHFARLNQVLTAQNFEPSKLNRRISGVLGKAKHWSSISWIAESFQGLRSGLTNFNVESILQIANQLQISSEFSLSSSMNLPEKISKTDRLRLICEHLGADRYLAPVGSLEYLKAEGVDAMLSSSIEVRIFDFASIEYPQLSSVFHPKMSVIDMIANIGDESSSRLIEIGSKQGE